MNTQPLHATVHSSTAAARQSINTPVRILRIMALSLFFCITRTLMSQNAGETSLALGAGSHVSGTGQGVFYTLDASIAKDAHVLTFSPCLQKRNAMFCGARVSYAYLLTGRPELQRPFNSMYNDEEEGFKKLQLHVFSYVQYVHQGQLSYTASQVEENTVRADQSTPLHISNMRFSTIEACSGIGMNIKLGSRLTWQNYLCAGTYYYLNYVKGMNKERIAPIISVGTALRFSVR